MVVDPRTGEVITPQTHRDMYRLDAIKNSDVWDDKTIKAEYNRLRRIANSRLERLSKSEFSNSEYLKQFKGGFKSVSKYSNMAELRAGLAEAARFVSAKTSSVTGQRDYRKTALQTLHERGYTFVNKSNFVEFGRFMEAWRADKEAQSYGSVAATELYEQVKKKKLDVEEVKEKFEQYLDHLEELQNMPRKKSKGEWWTNEDYEEHLGFDD